MNFEIFDDQRFLVQLKTPLKVLFPKLKRMILVCLWPDCGKQWEDDSDAKILCIGTRYTP